MRRGLLVRDGQRGGFRRKVKDGGVMQLRRGIWGVGFAVALAASGCFADSDDHETALFDGCEDNSDCVKTADACYIVRWTETTGTPRDGKMCSLECVDNDDCPSGSACYALEEDIDLDRRICYAQCDRDIDCDEGFACFEAEIEGEGVDFICMPL